MAKRRNRNKRSNRNTLTKGGAKRASAPVISASTPAASPASEPEPKTKSTREHAPAPVSSNDDQAKTTSKPVSVEATHASKLPQAAQLVGFTELDEAFFAAGESEPHLEQVAAAEDDAAPRVRRQRPSLWKRLFARAA